jgi:hypothetical protein
VCWYCSSWTLGTATAQLERAIEEQEGQNYTNWRMDNASIHIPTILDI